LILPYGATKSIYQVGKSWLVEFFDVRDAALAIKNLDGFVLTVHDVSLKIQGDFVLKINFHIPSARKWAHQENFSKTSGALSNIDLSNFQIKRADSDGFRKAYKTESGAWDGSPRMKISSSSSILGNVDEKWTLKERSADSFFSESNLHDYEREDKENEHVKSVEKSLNDWEGSLDNLKTLGNDLMKSNKIDFGLIGKL
jgi:hypothetical protein